MQYWGELQFGSRKKPFKIIFDTGSEWMFLPGVECETCVAEKYFSCSESKSCVQSTQNSIVNVTYGKGFISGKESYEEVYFSDNLFVLKQKLLVVIYQRDFDGFTADGLCGLGVQSFYDTEDFNIVKNLYKAGEISNQMFSFQLNREAYTDDENYSELLIGGYENSSLEENMSFFKVVNNQYWSIDMESVSADGVLLDENQQALLDTGSSILVAPIHSFNNFFSFLKQTRQCVLLSNFIKCSCPDGNINSFPILHFIFSGKEYSLEPNFYVKQIQNTCLVYITNLSGFSNMWILGDVFMHKYYTVFDGGNLTIGLAQRKILDISQMSGLNLTLIVVIIISGIFLAISGIFLIKKYCIRRRPEENSLLFQN